MKERLDNRVSTRATALIRSMTRYGMALAMLVPVLSGCATGAIVSTGAQRAPTKAAQVKVYLDAPAQYETLGYVEAKTDVSAIVPQASQNILFDGLKSQAAKLGANGVILIGTEEQTENVFPYQNPRSKSVPLSLVMKIAKGKAIHVIRE